MDTNIRNYQWCHLGERGPRLVDPANPNRYLFTWDRLYPVKWLEFAAAVLGLLGAIGLTVLLHGYHTFAVYVSAFLGGGWITIAFACSWAASFYWWRMRVEVDLAARVITFINCRSARSPWPERVWVHEEVPFSAIIGLKLVQFPLLFGDGLAIVTSRGVVVVPDGLSGFRELHDFLCEQLGENRSHPDGFAAALARAPRYRTKWHLWLLFIACIVLCITFGALYLRCGLS